MRQVRRRRPGPIGQQRRYYLKGRRCCDSRHWPILKVDVRSCREVSVNSGGEPERDDTGLPPVDIEIPDDARELDRDVQAYYRERRAERRRQRHHRMHGRIARDGIVLPLLACCLILALIAGTLLTVFTATSDQNFRAACPQRRCQPAPPAAPLPATLPRALPPLAGPPRLPLSPAITQTGKPLPAGTLRLTANNRPDQAPRPGPDHAGACAARMPVQRRSHLARRHRSHPGVPSYLVGTAQTIAEASELAFRAATPACEAPWRWRSIRQRVLSKHYPVRRIDGGSGQTCRRRPTLSISARRTTPRLCVQALTG